MAQKPSTPKGTRDFSPEVMLKRNYIMKVIKNAFQTFGYLPIETPSMEDCLLQWENMVRKVID